MRKQLIKQKNIYIFIITLTIIGLISGYLYYQFQPLNTKTTIIESLDIKSDLNNRVNNLPRTLKSSSKIIIYSILILPSIINIFNIFYEPFKIGFLFNLLNTYSIKLSLIYTLIYLIIPLLFTIILTKVGFTIIYSLVKKIIYYKKETWSRVIILLKKYFLISIFSYTYEIIVIVISLNINSYLMTFL